MSLPDLAFLPVTHRTDQYGRRFMARVVEMWNTLDNTVLGGVGLSDSSFPSTLFSYLVDGIFSFLLPFASCRVFSFS